MKSILTDLNAEIWKQDLETYLKTQALYVHILFDNSAEWRLERGESKLMKAYREEREAVLNEEDKLKEVEKEWRSKKREWLEKEDEEDQKWSREEDKTKGVIQASIDSSMLARVRECKTAKEMYTKLITHNNNNKNIHAYYNYVAYENINYKEGVSIGEYAKEFTLALERLKGTKCEQSEYCASMKLLSTLPREYAVSVQTLIQLDELPLEIVRDVLVRAEASMKGIKKEKKVQEEEVHNTSEKVERKKCANNKSCGGRVSVRAPKEAILCYKCYGEEIEKKKKKEREKEKYSKKSVKEKAEANNAKKKKKKSSESSDAESCFVEEESNSSEEEESDSSEREEDSEEEGEVSVCNVEEEREKNVWHIDSGATAHLTKNKKGVVRPRETSVRISGPLTNNKSSKASIKGEVILKIKDERN